MVKRHNNSQNGFTSVELIIVLVVIAVIAGVGLAVHHQSTAKSALLVANQKAAASAATKKSSSSTSQPTTATTPTTSSTPAATTSTTKSTATKKTTAVAVSHPTADELTLAKANLTSIQTMVEAYNANNGTYPEGSSLNTSALLTQPGVNGDPSVFTFPAGTSYTYVCQKGGPGHCAAYHLDLLVNGTLNEELQQQN